MQKLHGRATLAEHFEERGGGQQIAAEAEKFLGTGQYKVCKVPQGSLVAQTRGAFSVTREFFSKFPVPPQDNMNGSGRGVGAGRGSWLKRTNTSEAASHTGVEKPATAFSLLGGGEVG